jgi:hypothetical protein
MCGNFEEKFIKIFLEILLTTIKKKNIRRIIKKNFHTDFQSINIKIKLIFLRNLFF